MKWVVCLTLLALALCEGCTTAAHKTGEQRGSRTTADGTITLTEEKLGTGFQPADRGAEHEPR